MATLCGLFGVPHTPAFPKLVNDGVGPADEIRRMYARVRERVAAAEPDIVVVLSDDHINTFFLDNFPAFAVGMAPTTWGPNDGTDGLAPRPVRSDQDFADYLHAQLTAGGIEPAAVREFAIDHAMVVPLHFLVPDRDVAVVPLWINELVPPIPTAVRAAELGARLRRAVEEYDRDVRIALVASGSFSLEVGGVHISPNANYGVPDPEWTEQVVAHLQEGALDDLVATATPERLHRAGNVGGELLAWLAVWSAAEGRAPEFVNVQPQFGHAYASWEMVS